MTNLQTLLIVLGIIVAAMLVLAFVVPVLKKRGIDLDKVLAQTQSAINTASTAFALVKPFVDDKNTVDVGDKILTAASIGVGNAEQLLHIGKIPAERRHDEALKYVRDTLFLANVPWSNEVEALTEGAIQASVNALGHKPPTVVLEYKPPDGTTATEIEVTTEITIEE